MKHLPNIISIFRGLSALLICFLLSLGQYIWLCLALILYLIAIFTDFLDGYIARKYNVVSGLGKVLDATIDKVFFFILVSYFIYENVFSFYLMIFLLFIHIIRDVSVTWIRCHLLKNNIELNVLSTGQFKTRFSVSISIMWNSYIYSKLS